MTWKQIEASREVRLWVTQVVVPAATVVGVAMSIPEVRNTVTNKVKSVKETIQRKIKKAEG